MFKALVWKEGAFYVAQLLNVDISSFGKTQAEALANVREAAELYFEDSPISSVRKVESPKIVTTRIAHV